jgi:tetratricopeptide (TPR) repeat protein
VVKRKEQNKDDSCIACHMPARASEVNHSAITDHRIPRRPNANPQQAPKRQTPGPHDLVPFHRSLLAPDDPETARNLGLAIVGMFDRGMPEAAEKHYAQAALPLLNAARQRDPHDTPVALGLASTFWSLGRHEEAAELYDKVLEGEPNLEVACAAAGLHALAMNDAVRAKSHLQKAVRINPYRSHYHHNLAVAHFRLADINAAIVSCRQASTLDISNPKPRSLLIQCLLAQGQSAKAAEEYDRLRKLTPAERHASLASWYAEQLKQYGLP